MLDWFNRNGEGIQAIASVATAVVAAFALIGVWWQIDSARQIEQEQSAREIYREFLNLSIQNPQFADPDYCTIWKTKRASAYGNYVAYMLYTTEQALAVSSEWQPVMSDLFTTHRVAICLIEDYELYTPAVAQLIRAHQTSGCSDIPAC